jgi:dolichol-phosphate mannosyltransferase
MTGKPTDDITFSFVAPVYNEQEGLEHFYGRLKVVADELGEPYEIIFVNDGSTDDSSVVIRRLAEMDPRIKAVEFSRNFGHQVAVTAGYDFARGRAVISLDADCQHPPELIPEMVARWREGFEVVYTVRKDTRGISPLRRGIGRLTYRAIKLASGADLTDQADFRLLDRKAAEERAAGETGYTLKQLANVSLAGVFNFSKLPLRLAAAAGGLLIGAAFVYAIVALLLWPFGLAPGAWVSVTMAIVALFGVQFLFIGILGEYIGRIFEEAKGRPIYIVRQTIGFESAGPPARPGKRLVRQRAPFSDEDDEDFIVYT